MGRSGTYDADDGQWFQIALVLRSTRDWDWGRVEYRPLMLPKAGLAGEGQSFANRALTDLARKLLVLRRGYGLCANRRRGLPGGRFDGAYPPPIPGCEEGTRQVRTLARRLASKIARGSTPMRTLYWDRACCGQALYAWWAGVQCGPPPAQPPISRDPELAGSGGGRLVVNLRCGDFQPPPVLETPRCDRSERGWRRSAGSPCAMGLRGRSFSAA